MVQETEINKWSEFSGRNSTVVIRKASQNMMTLEADGLQQQKITLSLTPVSPQQESEAAVEGISQQLDS